MLISFKIRPICLGANSTCCQAVSDWTDLFQFSTVLAFAPFLIYVPSADMPNEPDNACGF